MEKTFEITLEDVIQADPTFRFFLREAEFEYDKLDWQIQVKGAALVLAINNYLDFKYR